jgi:hypothetical protein
MKRSALVLSILNAVFCAFSIIFLMFTPSMMKDATYFGIGQSAVLDGFKQEVLGNWGPNHQAIFEGSFLKDNPIMIGLLIAACVIVVLWVLHLVFIFVKKRPNVIIDNILWIVFGLISLDVLVMGFDKNYFAGTSGETVFDYLKASSANGLAKTAGYMPYILAGIALVLGLIGIAISLTDIIRYPGRLKKAKNAQEGTNENGTSAQLVTANGTTTYPTNGNADIKPNGYMGPVPTIVQYISYGEGPHGNTNKEEKDLTKDDIRALIAEEMNPNKAQPVVAQTKRDPEALEKDDVLTSDDLRAIIREELKKNDQPEDQVTTNTDGDTVIPENQILTSDDLRAIIREEISHAENKDSGAQPVKQVAPVASAPVEENNEDAVTSDELRAIIHDELEKLVNPQKANATTQNADEPV